MWLVITALVAGLAGVIWLLVRIPPVHPINQLDGPPVVPFFGNTHKYLGPRYKTYNLFLEYGRKYWPIYRTWISTFGPCIHPMEPKYVETILASNIHITKTRDYDYVSEWLGDGLLTTTGEKWHKNRKLLTPAFHFKILDEFVPVFGEKAKVLVRIFHKFATSGEEIDITPLVTRCALDIICETTMGYTLNAQEETQSEYVSAVYEINELFIHRMLRPWLYPRWIFNLSPTGRRHQELLKILHSFTKRVIRERKEQFLLKRKENKGNPGDDSVFGGKKQKTAFLDILLEAAASGGGLTDEDIRAEVDTFMFEGHDTTAMAMSWTLFYISAYPEIQNKCMEEQKAIFSGDDRAPTMADLAEMKYLERVIKETLRIKPSVPAIGRILEQNLKLEGFKEFIPGTNIHVDIFNVHRNPEVFPDPDKFDPDRFLPENIQGRHPYAYIPFSAGPRNCIGQKFAMLEMKSVISSVLRQFRLESSNPDFYCHAEPDIIMRPRFGLKTKIFKR